MRNSTDGRLGGTGDGGGAGRRSEGEGDHAGLTERGGPGMPACTGIRRFENVSSCGRHVIMISSRDAQLTGELVCRSYMYALRGIGLVHMRQRATCCAKSGAELAYGGAVRESEAIAHQRYQPHLSSYASAMRCPALT
eukprot:1535914-Rhodomonas_salina.5